MNPVVVRGTLKLAIVVAVCGWLIFKIALYAWAGQWVQCGMTAILANWVREALTPQ